MLQQVHYQDCKQIDYKTAWDFQESLLQQNSQLKLQAGRGYVPQELATQHHLLFCEHNPVYTLGKSGKIENMLISEEECKQQGIAFYPNNRGGDITYHGPGQITGYPIFDLEKFKPDIHWYMRQMEEVMIQTCADYGLFAERMEKFTGVWLHTKTDFPLKICAMGVRCSRWTTMHGFAFNVNTELKYFDYIIPCGLEGKGATSLQKELGREVDIQEVKEVLKKNFSQVFDYQYA
ncbi:MAG: lipoyl(octanoyl) transferase LipB [Bacteroidia bacterium]